MKITIKGSKITCSSCGKTYTENLDKNLICSCGKVLIKIGDDDK